MIRWIFIIFLSVPLFGNDKALQELIEGNKRYLEGHQRPSSPVQSPFAVIVACSDSRVAPEIIFDQHLGDLFVVRVAGNVVGDLEMESIHFAVDNLHSSIVVVMGHEYCGAVDAVLHHNVGDIQSIAALIQPAIEGMDNLESAIKANVNSIVNNLRKFLQVKVVGAYYDFETGKVEFLSD